MSKETYQSDIYTAKETYKRDIFDAPELLLLSHKLAELRCIKYVKRDLPKRHIRSKRDLQKRHVYIKCVKRDLPKRPIKETHKRDMYRSNSSKENYKREAHTSKDTY